MLKQLLKPKYLLIWLVATLATSFVLIWFFNFQLLTYLYSVADLNILEVVGVMLGSVGDVYSRPADVRSVLFIVFSVLMGANLALLWYIRQARAQLETKKRFLASSSGAALIGAGCISCGGSIIVPILSLVGATATTALSRNINILAFVTAIGLAGFALYRMDNYYKKYSI